MSPRRPDLLRGREGVARVTNVELFFDLVYAFAVTQLSEYLVRHQSAEGALQTALLLLLVWQVWVYTTWATNWLDPERLPVRALLLALALVSLVMSAALPDAFGDIGWVVGAAYVVMQVGRSVFAIRVIPPGPLRLNFQRVLVWSMVSGLCALTGGAVHGHARELLWAITLVIDVVGGLVGFITPGLGRSTTTDWTIEGNHFAERCQGFVLMALGESVVAIGASVSGLQSLSASEIFGFVVGFVGCLTLWWVYFDRSAGEGEDIIAASADPGRLGRDAYHLIHPAMIAGIIVVAAADEEIVAHPADPATAAVAWMILGGTALFLAGHALFKSVVWRVWPWVRGGAIVALGLLGLVARHVPAWALSALAIAVIVGVVLADRRMYPRAAAEGRAGASAANAPPGDSSPVGPPPGPPALPPPGPAAFPASGPTASPPPAS